MGKIIGIVPSFPAGAPAESAMEDFYRLGNNYIKAVTKAGGTAIGLAPADLWLAEDALSLCDGFLVQGGAEFYPYHFQVIHHAVTTGKRYLGICLGEQLIYAYFRLKQLVEAQGYEGDLVTAICSYLQAHGPQFSVLQPIPNHRTPHPPRGCEEQAKHDVTIEPGTLLHRVVGRDTISIATFHSLHIPQTQTLLPINAWSALGDGVVEGTEYGENILGVQGHPEIDDLLPELFTFLTKN